MTDRPEAEKLEPFQREERYIVIKRKYLNNGQEADIRDLLADKGIGTIECVVVESDWPEHETVWLMIEARCMGNPAQPVADAGGVTDADRELHMWLTGYPLDDGDSETVRRITAHHLQSVAAATAAKDAEIARLEDAINRAAMRFDLAAENGKERAVTYRKWASEARAALSEARRLKAQQKAAA